MFRRLCYSLKTSNVAWLQASTFLREVRSGLDAMKYAFELWQAGTSYDAAGEQNEAGFATINEMIELIHDPSWPPAAGEEGQRAQQPGGQTEPAEDVEMQPSSAMA